MLSRYLSLALLVVLTGAVVYIAWQLPRADSHRAGRLHLPVGPVPLEEAVKNSRTSTVRSDAVISVESCKQAQDGFLRGITDDTAAAETPEEIESSLQSILAQVGDEAGGRMHLTCLMHQYPVGRGKPAKSKSG